MVLGSSHESSNGSPILEISLTLIEHLVSFGGLKEILF